MTLQVSTKFKERILGPESFVDIFTGGRILVYSGAQPDTADDAVTGTLLGEITADDGAVWVPGGAGALAFAQDGPWVLKSPGQSWSLRCDVAGVAGWFRLVPGEDAGNLSFNHARIDGAIGTGGDVELVLASTTLAAAQTYDVLQFAYTIPPILGA